MTASTAQTVVKAFEILKSFKDPEEWVSCSEVSRRAGLPQASGHRLMQTLVGIGAIVRGYKGRYRPGMLLVTLSGNVVIVDLVRTAGAEIAAELSARLDATVHIGVLEHGMVTYAVKATTPSSFRTETAVGAQLEPYCSGLGKVLLAGLPPEDLDAILFDGALVPLTPRTIVDKIALRRHLGVVCRQGYAIDDGEFRLDTGCVAVPIVDQFGRTIAALSITDALGRMTADRQAQLRGELQAGATLIGARLSPAQARPPPLRA